VFGWIFTAHQLGGATAAFAAGVSRDALASYCPPSRPPRDVPGRGARVLAMRRGSDSFVPAE